MSYNVKNAKLKCLLVEPNNEPIEIEINDDLKSKQQLVEGYIEYAYLPDDEDIVLICNEEGKINGMKWNRDIGYDIIAGPFLIVGNDSKNGVQKSLTEEQILKYKIKFGKESIVRTQNKIISIILGKKIKSEESIER